MTSVDQWYVGDPLLDHWNALLSVAIDKTCSQWFEKNVQCASANRSISDVLGGWNGMCRRGDPMCMCVSVAQDGSTKWCTEYWGNAWYNISPFYFRKEIIWPKTAIKFPFGVLFGWAIISLV